MNTFFDDRQGSARYLLALREHWLLVLLLVAIAVGAAAAYAFTAEERYEAEADMLVTPVSADDDTYIGINLLRESDQTRSVLTAARLIKNPAVATAVKERLSLLGSRGEVLDAVEVRPQEQSSFVTIVGKASSPRRAAAIANAFADVTIEQRTSQFQADLRAVIQRLTDQLEAIPRGEREFGEAIAIQQRLGELASLVDAKDPTLSVSSRAVSPESPVWPRPVLSVAVALLAALLLGSGAAVALELLNPRIRREDELQLEHRLPILARVPRMRRGTIRGYLAGREPLPGDVREAFRTLRATLSTAGRDGGFPSSILVASTVPAEGKTMAAVNLSVTLALGGLRTILVDGDLRRPMVGTVFGAPPRAVGFASLLHGEASPDEVLTQAPGHGARLQLVLSSPEHGHLVDLLRRDQLERVLAELRFRASVVVFDSPPLTEVADALTLADTVEGVILAVRLGRTRRDKLADMRRLLAQVGVAPLGCVVISRRRSRRHGYYYGGEPPVPARRRRRRVREEPSLVRSQAGDEEL